MKEIVKNYHLHFNDEFTVSNVFEFCYKMLHEKFRNEYFYKNTIANKILKAGKSSRNSTMFTEFRVGGCKADCVIVNGIATCYEIKTEYDNLTKLNTQIKEYTKVFDKINVVVPDKYVQAVCEKVPIYIGVIQMTRTGSLRVVRAAMLIRTRLDTELLMRSLRRNEYIGLAKALIGYAPVAENTEIFRECGRLIAVSDDEKIRKCFRSVMKKTRALDANLIALLPSFLTMAAVESNLSYNARINFLKNIDAILNKD